MSSSLLYNEAKREVKTEAKKERETMYAQGKSLGKQLSAYFGFSLLSLIEESEVVWFLGRDCDVFYEAFRGMFPKKVRYIEGLNRENARKLQHRHKLCKWLRSLGVKKGHVIVDSGYRGSIFERIAEDDKEFSKDISLVLLTASNEGHYGRPLMDESVCGQNDPIRHVILALEHSPKRGVVEWNQEKKVPLVTNTGPKGAFSFFNGCVDGIKEGTLMK